MANFSVEWLSKSCYEGPQVRGELRGVTEAAAQQKPPTSPSNSCGDASGSESEGGDDSEGEAAQQRRTRTKFTSEQISRLEDTFSKHKYLGSGQRRKMAEKLNLSETQVKTWFQNRRMKLKRQVQDLRPDFLSVPAALLLQHPVLSGQLLSGQHPVLSGQFPVLSGQFPVLSGQFPVLSGQLLSGQHPVLSGQFPVLSGQLPVLSGQLLSGQHPVLSGQFPVLSGQFPVLSGQLLSGQHPVLSGQFPVLSGQLPVLSGQLLSGQHPVLSGQLPVPASSSGSCPQLWPLQRSPPPARLQWHRPRPVLLPPHFY